ncbi:tyrosine-type recombinase/integrase, partial [Kitasatospora aureofaciens]|uniref:tyrosine-type recombinase/integrase n=2 Tax=Kitasatospora aureofaciens TaxID=1894 RepID=UPI001C456B83
RGLNVSGFNRDTVLVAGQELPSPFVQPVYSARDFVISEETARLYRDARPTNTRRNVDNQIKLFEQWCAERDRVALPCTTATLIEYVGWMINSGRYDPNTVSAYKSAVVTWQERKTPGRTRPGTIEVKEMISAFRSQWARTNTEKQSPAVREADLEEMVAACDERGRPADLRDAAILTLGFHLLTRRIELARLVVTHLTLHADGMDVRLVDRKTRKDGSVYEGWVPARDDAPTLCPVRRMRAWLDYGRRIRQPEHEAVFRALDKAGRLAQRLTKQSCPQHSDCSPSDPHDLTTEEWTELSFLSGEAINGYVKARAKAAERRLARLTEEERVEHGFNALLNLRTAARVTAHGLRAGGATELKEAGVPEDQIAEMGDWAKDSKAMQRYFRAIKAKAQNPWALARASRAAGLNTA